VQSTPYEERRTKNVRRKMKDKIGGRLKAVGLRGRQKIKKQK
jgi:hypothetical protein